MLGLVKGPGQGIPDWRDLIGGQGSARSLDGRGRLSGA